MVWWHAYQTRADNLDSQGTGTDIFSALMFTVVGPTHTTPDEAQAEIMTGHVFGHDLGYTYTTSWDHEPTTEEKDTVRWSKDV